MDCADVSGTSHIPKIQYCTISSSSSSSSSHSAIQPHPWILVTSDHPHSRSTLTSLINLNSGDPLLLTPLGLNPTILLVTSYASISLTCTTHLILETCHTWLYTKHIQFLIVSYNPSSLSFLSFFLHSSLDLPQKCSIYIPVNIT